MISHLSLLTALLTLAATINDSECFSSPHRSLSPHVFGDSTNPVSHTSTPTKARKQSRPPHMAPRYDPTIEKWIATKPEEESGAGYSPLGSLLRQGPKPFLLRLTNPEQYDQAVLKMMATDLTMDRNEAQGNMDAYLNNPNDWALQKLSEKNSDGKKKYDYANANMDPKQLVLTGIWASVVFGIAGRMIYVALTGGAPQYLYDLTN